MRGCVLSGLVLLLLVTNGYALWQIVHLRTEVAELRAAVAALDRRQAEPEANLAEAALRAVQQGQWERARAALEQLADRVGAAEALVDRPRKELQRRLAAARTAVARKQRDAAAALQALRDEFSPPGKAPEGRRKDALLRGTCPGMEGSNAVGAV